MGQWEEETTVTTFWKMESKCPGGNWFDISKTAETQAGFGERQNQYALS